jgi:hypothetical protein
MHLFSAPTPKSVVDQAVGRLQRIEQSRIVLVYEYEVHDTFNIYLVNMNRNTTGFGLQSNASEVSLAV